MDDVAPPQDPAPSMNDYDKPADGGEGAAAPADGAAAMGGGEAGMVNDSDMNEPSSGGGGNLYLRPIFLGNLSHGCMASDVENIFQNPAPSGNSMDGEVKMPYALDRVVSET